MKRMNQESINRNIINENILSSGAVTLFSSLGFSSLGLFLLSFLFYPAVSFSEQAGRELAVAAEVNSRPITMESLEYSLRRELGAELQGFSPSDRHYLSTKLLEKMVDRELLFQQAEKNNLVPSDTEVASILLSLEQKLPRTYSLDEELSKSGLNRQHFSSALRIDLGVKNYLETFIFSGMSVSDEEVKQRFLSNARELTEPKEMKLRQIFLATRQKTNPESLAENPKEKLKMLRQSVVSGEMSFEQLARSHSESTHAGRGGDLGWLTPNQLPTALRKAALSLKPGELSEVINTEKGYYLLKLEAERGGATPRFEDIQADLKKNLIREKQEELLKEHLKSLREKNQVILYLR